MRRTDLYLKTVCIICIIIFKFEQVLDCEYFLLQVVDSEKLKAIVSFENVVVAAHTSLYRIYSIITDLVHILLFLLIPYYQFIVIKPYQVD